MVAKIVTGKNIRGILHYNEQKVEAGDAKLILASGFAGEIERMDFKQKLARFENLNLLRPTVRTNALHITLNFDASEKLDHAKVQQIAMAYMEGIGFGEQPYLVYRHQDAAHEHIHIATTSIQRNGRPIQLHRLGPDKSEPVRKQLEQDFNLVVAEKKAFKIQPGIKPADPEKALYGRLPTKRALSNVVTAVMSQYSYTSLAEFNAVLRSFNVIADRGAEESLMYQKKGLLYSLLDKQGNKIGIPIKASAFYHQSTLRNLEKKFEQNIERRKLHREPLKQAIEKVFKSYQQLTKNTFIKELGQQNIQVLFRSNDKGFIYGVTFIDHQRKAAFNGSDLGKGYSAKGLSDRFSTLDKKIALMPQAKLQPVQTLVPTAEPTNYLQIALAKYQPQAAPSMTKKKKRKGQQQDQELTI